MNILSTGMDDLRLFGDINEARCTDPKAFNMSLDPAYFLLCLQQELGEVSAIYTKLKRGYNKREQKKMYKKKLAEWDKNHPGIDPTFEDGTPFEMEWRKQLQEKLGPEIGDLLAYLSLAARSLGIADPMEHAINKFNQVSNEMEVNYHILINSTPTAPEFPKDRY